MADMAPMSKFVGAPQAPAKKKFKLKPKSKLKLPKKAPPKAPMAPMVPQGAYSDNDADDIY